MSANDKITLWAVYGNTDNTEGRGTEYLMYLCEMESTAIRLGSRKYVQGTDCPIRKVEVVKYKDGVVVLPMHLLRVEKPSAVDVLAQERKDARRAAEDRARGLGLTEAEIAALRS